MVAGKTGQREPDRPCRPRPGNADIVIHDRPDAIDGAGNPVASRKDSLIREVSRLAAGRFSAGAGGLSLPASPVTTLRLYPETRDLEDLWVVVSWAGA